MRAALLPRVALSLLALCLAFALGASCAALGYTNRVLWRVPSSDGRMIAVCQEIPMFDGPGFEVRLERPDATLLRHLYRIGDGDPCSEIAWSTEGRTLAVLSSHVARVMFVDVAWALDHPSAERVPWRSVSLANQHGHTLGRGLRFAGPLDLELQLCPYSETQQSGEMRCLSPAELRRFQRPPIPAAEY